MSRSRLRAWDNLNSIDAKTAHEALLRNLGAVSQAWRKWVIRLDGSGGKPGALGFISTFLFAGALAVLGTTWQSMIDYLEQHFQRASSE
jgi:hypothetical protein